ncbi:hypothetical protein AB0M32_51485 [Streptomyces sp. NPDC051985]|uniref:hypothetical protein n=1 Tax=Streptomyces sp. NPDC051985 TaxID=3155807 RepID=UPI003432E656
MTTSSWDRSRRFAAASVLTVITVVVAAVVLALGAGVPDAWWPHTGQAFAADAAHQDSCALIAGPAKTSCERGATRSATGQQDAAGGAWRLLPAGAGVGALVVWRLRSAAGQRRR